VVPNSGNEISRHPGTYAVVMRLETPLSVNIGKLGMTSFESGHLCYIGSAMNGLKARVSRHLRSNKRMHWHIDYLLTHAHIVDVFWSNCRERLECSVAREISIQGLPSIKGFGSSDCSCPSHLFYDRELEKLNLTIQAAFRPILFRRTFA
ncbi:uncharacterized protein METZ01_LOCUS357993, partial [marine metagenome]